MPVAGKMHEFMDRSSWIRKMFENGARLKAEHGSGKVFDFSLGNPKLEPPVQFQQVVQELVADRTAGVHGYMPNAGYQETREAVARTVAQEQDTPVAGDHLVMTCGAGGGLNVVLKAILDPQDEVVVPTPHFVEYGFYADNHGGVLRHAETTEDFDLDVEAIEATVTPKTRAVLINSPNNPTGRVYGAETLRSLGVMLEAKQKEIGRTIYLISDEPYRKIVYGGVEVPPVMAFYSNTLVVSSYSKDLSLAGERIGYVAAHPGVDGIDKLMGALILANRILGFVNAPALMQRAVARLQGVSVDISPYEENRDLLYGTLTEAGFSVPEPEGAFYLFPKSPIQDDAAFARELQDRLVLVVPGSGFMGPGHVRISYCVSRQTVEGALPIFREIGERYFG